MADEKTGTTTDSKRTLLWSAFALCVVGVGVSGYLLSEHWTGGMMLGCSKNGTFDCEAVNRSIFSEIKGIPLALYGMAAYVICAVLLLRRLRVGAEEGDGAVGMVWLLSIVAIAMDCFLLWAQITKIGHYCPWCMSTYGISLLLFVLSWMIVGGPAGALAGIKREWDSLSKSKPLAYVLILLIILTAGFITFKKPPEGAGTWCLFGNVCTNEATGRPAVIGVNPFNNGIEEKAREQILHAPFLDPGPGSGYARGAANPVLTIVEFGDLECPACRHFSWVIDDFMEKHPNEVRQVFRHYPLDLTCNPNVHVKIHEFACATARAAEAAGLQGKFWEYEMDVYKRNDEKGNFIQKPDLTEASLEARAKKLGLNVDEWKKAESSDPVITKIVDDTTMGGQVGINSTPTLFVNGRMISGGAGEDYLETWLKMAKNGELDPHGPPKTPTN